jgi:hypothetical protein
LKTVQFDLAFSLNNWNKSSVIGKLFKKLLFSYDCLLLETSCWLLATPGLLNLQGMRFWRLAAGYSD